MTVLVKRQFDQVQRKKNKKKKKKQQQKKKKKKKKKNKDPLHGTLFFIVCLF